MSAVERLSAFQSVCYYTVYEDMAFSFQIFTHSHFSNNVEWWPYIAGNRKNIVKISAG